MCSADADEDIGGGGGGGGLGESRQTSSWLSSLAAMFDCRRRRFIFLICSRSALPLPGCTHALLAYCVSNLPACIMQLINHARWPVSSHACMGRTRSRTGPASSACIVQETTPSVVHAVDLPEDPNKTRPQKRDCRSSDRSVLCFCCSTSTTDAGTCA